MLVYLRDGSAQTILQAMEEGRLLECPKKTRDDVFQKMPRTEAQNSSPNRDSNRHCSIGARKADVLTITPCTKTGDREHTIKKKTIQFWHITFRKEGVG